VIGRTYSHYKILEKIGGGMSVVYRAEDTETGESVALKFLPPEFTSIEDARKRFIREAQAVSGLDHPNICRINEIVETPDGRLFICMPLYDGETLRDALERGPLPIARTLEIAHEIATGLSYAHERDVVHRDIKPENIFLVRGGPVKILDFGLAKLAGQSRLTPARARVGTVAYLSPEQARGDEVDRRTDIWSLGATLYEMLTGRRAFRGDAEPAVIYFILNADPNPVTDLRPECPQHLAEIVRRCLQKDPKQRYQWASELIQQFKILASGLRMDRALFKDPLKEVPVAGAASTLGRVFWPAAAVVTVLLIMSILVWEELHIDRRRAPLARQTRLRVAVLPLENRAGLEPGDAFVAGLSATVASTAVELEPFRDSMWVLPYSHTSDATLKNPANARGAFGVNFLLGGSVRRHGEGYRLTLDFLDAHNLKPVESKHIDFRRESVQSLYTGVFEAVADLLDVKAPAEERPSPRTTGTADVFESYLEGVGILRRSDEDADVEQAIDSLQRTVANDSLLAPAHLWLAEAFREKWRYTGDQVWLGKAEASCKKALQLDGSKDEAYVTLAEVYEAGDRINLALQSYAKALALNPRDSEANLRLGELLASQNRPDEAEASYLKLIEVEPDYYEGHRVLGRFYHSSGRIDEAVVEYERALSLAPDDWWTLDRLAAAYHEQGRWEQTRETLVRSLSIDRRLSLEDLRSDPLLADLRADPRLRPLIDQNEIQPQTPTPPDTTRP
jgi:serine/threonine protein kinase/cytochrome c-type biogenesis protein CcmH/NrfG